MEIAIKNKMLDLMTKYDCKDLKKMIVENPELPLLIFCGEDSYYDDGYGYCSQQDARVCIQELVLYNNEWIEKSDYRDKLKTDGDFSNEEFDKYLDKLVEEVQAIKAICVWVG